MFVPFENRHMGIAISHNRPLAVMRKMVLRHHVSRAGRGWRWRIMAEETQMATGICRTHTEAKNQKAIAAAEIIRKERNK